MSDTQAQYIVDPTRFIPVGAILETQDGERYVVLKPNTVNLRSERVRDGGRFNIPRNYPFAVVGNKSFDEVIGSTDIEMYNVVKYIGPKFEKKLMTVVRVDLIGKTLSLADIDEPRKRLNRVPFSSVEKRTSGQLANA